jgi:hypothetical protein
MTCRFGVSVLLGFLPTVVCTAAAQTARVGVHYGVNLSDGHWDDERLGAQASVHIIGPLETAGAFSVFTDWPGTPGSTGSAWQAYWTMRVRPRGPWSIASAGYGFILLHSSLRNATLQLDVSGSHFTDAIVLGLEGPTPYVRPFADLYLVDILDRESAVGVNLLMGIQIRLPTRRSR